MTPNVRMQRRGVIEAKIGLTSLAYITGRKTFEKFPLVGLQKKKKHISISLSAFLNH